MSNQSLETDVLIIGTGLGGCSTAISLALSGADITMITAAREPEYSATAWAQGGIVYEGEVDSPQDLVEDILTAGAGISYDKAAQLIAHEGPHYVKKILIDLLGVSFQKSADGKLLRTEEAVHRLPRILFAHDQTGQEIEKKCLNYLKTLSNVRILTEHTAIDLLTPSHHSANPQDRYEEMRCVGAFVLDQSKNQVKQILARETVLATGGLGQLYLHTTNPKFSRGDGLVMAYRTGARIMNLEYLQFHPTTFYAKNKDRFLITEAMRGEGARLLTADGKAFMSSYHADGELAPRDVVSRAIHDEILKTKTESVFLDISHRDSQFIKQRFPYIYKRCLKNGIDITQEPIPVVPAAHYSCGGIKTDLTGHTTLQGLWAVGEVACTGLHGANRLASTSLLEDLVIGQKAGEALWKKIGQDHHSRRNGFPHISDWVDQTEDADIDLITQDWMTIKQTMWNYVGLVRTPKRLNRALAILSSLRHEADQFYANCRINDELIGIRNAALAAHLVVNAAQRNKISRGCHFIRDNP